MEHHDPLMVGMFWAGLLVASIPILITLVVGVHALRWYLREGRDQVREQRRGAEGRMT